MWYLHMPDDLRDIGASDFVRFEKIRERISSIVTDLDLVTNATPGVLQIDPVITTYILNGRLQTQTTGFWQGNRQIETISQTIGAASSGTVTIASAFTDVWVAVAGLVFQTNSDSGSVILQLSDGTDVVELSRKEINYGTTNTVVYRRIDGTFASGDDWRALRPRIVPPGQDLELEFLNTSPGDDNDVDVRVSFCTSAADQPVNIPFN